MVTSTVKPGYFGQGSVDVAPPAAPGEGPVRRLAITCSELVTQPMEGIKTTCDVVEYGARAYGDVKAVGWRDIVKVHEEEKEVKKVVDGKETTQRKKWNYFELSDYRYLSYVEVKIAISEVARGLVHLGVTKEEVFNVYAQTSVNWQLVSHACAYISTTIATAYDTLGESGLAHSLNEPLSVGIFTNSHLLPTVLKVLKSTPSLRIILYDGDPDLSVLAAVRAVRDDLKVLSITDLRDIGRVQSLEHVEARRPTKDTLACIMYTSGSTGAPKGVCLTHTNIIASVGSVYTIFGHHFTAGNKLLAYLPLAHVLEYIIELCAFFMGVTSGYGNAKTLTDASVRNCRGDLNTLNPTIMFGVPAVWETIRKGIVGQVNSGGRLKRMMFDGAMKMKKDEVPILAGVADSVVLGAVRAATGGQLRFIVNGGAAVSRETQEFLSLALVPMIQGYGLTESCGMCAMLPPEVMQYGTVGLPVPSLDVKLLDVPAAGYTSSDDPPRGEICIRGPSVTKGYYKRPDLNEDDNIFTKDGWFRTGDVGQWNADGTLSVIDRIKNIVKLQNGEYIALEHLESIYKSCHFVSNLCLQASQQANQPIAIIIPYESHLRQALQSSGVVDHTLPLDELCNDERVKKIVLDDCNSDGKANGFKQNELLQGVILTPEEWTPHNGFVTAAQKIQRGKISKKFEREIEELYATK